MDCHRIGWVDVSIATCPGGVSGATGGGVTSSRAVATDVATHGDVSQEIPGGGAHERPPGRWFFGVAPMGGASSSFFGDVAAVYHGICAMLGWG